MLSSEAQMSIRFVLWPPFSRYKVVENRKSTQWPQINDLKHLTVKVPCIHWILTTRAVSLRFALGQVIFVIQACRNQKCTKWPSPLDCQKLPVYTEHLSRSPKFHSVSLYGRSFSCLLSLFSFSLGCNGEIRNSLKIRNSNFKTYKQ